MPHSGLAQRGSPVFTVAEVKHQLGITYAGANALVFRFAETCLVHEVTDADAIASSNADQFSNCSMTRINRDLDAAASSGSETFPLNGNPESSPQRQQPIELRTRRQSNADPGSVFLPGATSLWPTIRELVIRG